MSIAASDAFALDRALQEVNDVLDEGKREFGGVCEESDETQSRDRRLKRSEVGNREVGEAQRAGGDGERGGNRQGFFESVVEIFWRSGRVLWSPLL